MDTKLQNEIKKALPLGAEHLFKDVVFEKNKMVVKRNLEDQVPAHLENKEFIDIHQTLSQFDNIEFKYFSKKIEIKQKIKND